MAQVTVRIGGYAHPVACQDGQEKHLTNMAAEVDKRISALKGMGIQFGETRMLLLAALQLADEAVDLKAENDALKAGGAVAAEAPAPDPRWLMAWYGLLKSLRPLPRGLRKPN